MIKKHYDPRKASARVKKIILDNHFEWCKKEQRDINWYPKEIKTITKQKEEA